MTKQDTCLFFAPYRSEKRNQEKCIPCMRWINDGTGLVDNFKRRAT